MDTQCSVTLKETVLSANDLLLTTIDSAAEDGKKLYKIPLLKDGEILLREDVAQRKCPLPDRCVACPRDKRSRYCRIMNQWVFADRNCYHLTL